MSSGEDFECSCGIDPAIKIDYKPLKKLRNNNKGWMTKTDATECEQLIDIKNTHSRDVKIRVTEHLPESTETAIKV